MGLERRGAGRWRRKAMRDEEKPAPVSETKHVGEAQARWDWVERSVWTDRMLKALATGGKTTWERRFPRAEAVLLHCSPPLGHSILFEVNHQPESPVREIRTPGSEGGAADQPPSLPLAAGLDGTSADRRRAQGAFG